MPPPGLVTVIIKVAVADSVDSVLIVNDATPFDDTLIDADGTAPDT